MFDWQEQIIIGTVLGGSSLTKPPKGKNYYLSMRSKDDLWLKWKMAHLSSYYKNVELQNYSGTFRANTPCLSKLTSLQNKLYGEEGRDMQEEVLDLFMDIGIAVWFLDGGGRTGRGKKNAYLNATKFGDAGAKLVMEYFSSLDMPCSLNKSKTRIRVLFTVQGTKELFRLIAPHFPRFMYHRLEGIVIPAVAA